MIPKIIHYCWFGGNELPEESKDILSLGKDTVQITRLLNGAKKTLM